MDQDGIRVYVSQELSDLLARGSDKPALVKVLRRSVAQNSKPTLAAVLARTPFLKGQLQASLGLTNKINASKGEVYTIVGVKDNASVMVGGTKTLFSSMKLKRAAKHAARVGASKLSSATAFKYIRGIETGYKANGKLARRVGGAHMIEGGASDGAQEFIDGVGDDALGFVMDGHS